MNAPPVWIAIGMLALAITMIVLAADRASRPAVGRHRNPFTDPRDRTDPDGRQYVSALRETELPVPVAERRSPDLARLTRTLNGTGWLPAVPDDEPSEITGVQPVAVCELGQTTEAYIDELFARYEAGDEGRKALAAAEAGHEEQDWWVS